MAKANQAILFYFRCHHYFGICEEGMVIGSSCCSAGRDNLPFARLSIYELFEGRGVYPSTGRRNIHEDHTHQMEESAAD